MRIGRQRSICAAGCVLALACLPAHAGGFKVVVKPQARPVAYAGVAWRDERGGPERDRPLLAPRSGHPPSKPAPVQCSCRNGGHQGVSRC